MKIRVIISLFVLSLVGTLRAQVPNWSVEPSNYTYSMTITSYGALNCAPLQSPNDMIGAFVNGECVGVSSAATQVDGKFVAFLLVYSNSVSGDSVEFKIYDATADQVMDAGNIEMFEDGKVVGSPSNIYPVYFGSEFVFVDIAYVAGMLQFMGTVTPAMNFTWYKDGVEIVGETGYEIAPDGSGVYSLEVSGSSICASTSNEVDMSLVSVKEVEDEMVVIYPNPFKDELKIVGSSGFVTIVNLLGEVVYQTTNLRREKIVLDHLVNGVYLVNVNGKTHKLIKN